MATLVEAVPQPERRPHMLALLKEANFRRLWLAQSVSWSGDHFTFLAVMIVLNTITGSASAIALLMMVMTVPRLVFGMAAGVFVDRWDRKRLMVVSDSLRMLLSLCLIFVVTPERIWLVYPLAFAISSVGVFFMPARGAVMKTIVPQDQLLQANVLMQMTYTMTVVLGPALAGITIGLFGAAPAFLLDAATFGVSATLIASMSIPRLAARAGAAGRAAFWGELREGLAYVAGKRTIVGLLLVMTVLSLATGAINAMFVPFMMNVIGVGAIQLGIVDSAQAIGMILGSVLAASVAARLRANHLLAGGFGLASICIIAIGMASRFQVVLLLLFAVGLIIAPLQAVIPALTQKVVPHDKMGRVGGTMSASQSFATLASMGAAGILADVIGLRLVFVGAGAVGLLAAVCAFGIIRDE